MGYGIPGINWITVSNSANITSAKAQLFADIDSETGEVKLYVQPEDLEKLKRLF
ncbi:hypothetical protein FC34_GL000898 [Lacticaseibacillus brantae DSM 23927]|uniref:Uncharacterized protein n=2 Tax=Lacticaseibacillus brantae TaxID=943673 RepID=A0A0R2AYD0_9LACO|nr:hypothetical protein FC34_GL000898 [Lacticaseibacillus brantae DSM 23927]